MYIRQNLGIPPAPPWISFPGAPPILIDDNDVFINIGQLSPMGPPGPPGPPGNPGIVPITLVTTTPFTAALTDYFLGINVPSAASIILPASITGTVFVVKDTSGNASSNPITVTAATTIDGSTSSIINNPYGSITFVFNGTEWNNT